MFTITSEENPRIWFALSFYKIVTLTQYLLKKINEIGGFEPKPFKSDKIVNNRCWISLPTYNLILDLPYH